MPGRSIVSRSWLAGWLLLRMGRRHTACCRLSTPFHLAPGTCCGQAPSPRTCGPAWRRLPGCVPALHLGLWLSASRPRDMARSKGFKADHPFGTRFWRPPGGSARAEMGGASLGGARRQFGTPVARNGARAPCSGGAPQLAAPANQLALEAPTHACAHTGQSERRSHAPPPPRPPASQRSARPRRRASAKSTQTAFRCVPACQSNVPGGCAGPSELRRTAGDGCARAMRAGHRGAGRQDQHPRHRQEEVSRGTIGHCRRAADGAPSRGRAAGAVAAHTPHRALAWPICPQVPGARRPDGGPVCVRHPQAHPRVARAGHLHVCAQRAAADGCVLLRSRLVLAREANRRLAAEGCTQSAVAGGGGGGGRGWGWRRLTGACVCFAFAAALMSEIHSDYADEDGFVYVVYSGENTFGAC